MLLVWRQEGHPSCKKTDWYGAGMVIYLEQGADLYMAQLMLQPLIISSPLNPDWFYLSGTSSPRYSWTKFAVISVMVC